MISHSLLGGILQGRVLNVTLNEMNRALGHLCAHIGLPGPGKPPENGEMIEMTLSSRHRIRKNGTLTTDKWHICHRIELSAGGIIWKKMATTITSLCPYIAIMFS